MFMADEKMVQNTVQPQGNEEVTEEEVMDVNEEEEDCSEEDIESLHAQLDMLNSALDSIESKNNYIQGELLELLKSNQETRLQIQQSQKDSQAEGTTPQ